MTDLSFEILRDEKSLEQASRWFKLSKEEIIEHLNRGAVTYQDIYYILYPPKEPEIINKHMSKRFSEPLEDSKKDRLKKNLNRYLRKNKRQK